MSIPEPADLSDLTYNEPFVTIGILLVVVLGATQVFWDALERADRALALDPGRRVADSNQSGAQSSSGRARWTHR